MALPLKCLSVNRLGAETKHSVSLPSWGPGARALPMSELPTPCPNKAPLVGAIIGCRRTKLGEGSGGARTKMVDVAIESCFCLIVSNFLAQLIDLISQGLLSPLFGAWTVAMYEKQRGLSFVKELCFLTPLNCQQLKIAAWLG